MTRSGTANRAADARAALARLAPALPAAAFVAAAFAWPLVRLLRAAFTESTSEGGVAIAALFRSEYYRRAMWNSIALSAAVAAASVLLCLPAAIALARGRFRGKDLLRSALAVPLSMSGIVIGFLGVAMLGNVGWLPTVTGVDAFRGTAYGLSGLAIGYLYFEIPRATLTMEAALAAVDEGLLEAARTLGATPAQTMARVFLPLCAPAMRAAFAVTFAASIGSFGVALMIAGRFPILTVELFRAATGSHDTPLAAAMALFLAVAALLVLGTLSLRRAPATARRPGPRGERGAPA